MIERPQLHNGVLIPYEANLEEIRSQLLLPGPRAWAACVALGYNPTEEALAILMELATSPDWRYRRAATEAIARHRMGKSTAPLLYALLDDLSHYVVRTACKTVSQLQLHEAHDAVLPLLRSDSASTRCASLDAVAKLWEPSDFGAVFKIYCTDSSTEVRRQAAWTLKANADQANWGRLFDAWIRDDLPRHRVWACDLAGQFGESAISGRIKPLLEDLDGHVRKAAAAALKELASHAS